MARTDPSVLYFLKNPMLFYEFLLLNEHRCVSGPCTVADYLQAIQATAVLACVFAILALFVFVAQLFTLPKGQRFTFTGVLQLLSCKLQGGKTVFCYLKEHQFIFKAQCVANSSVQMTLLATS